MCEVMDGDVGREVFAVVDAPVDLRGVREMKGVSEKVSGR